MRDQNLWAFYTEGSFSGNAKWLFDYVVHERPDIKAYWICADHKLRNRIRSLGYKAYMYLSDEAYDLGLETGVFVVDDYDFWEERFYFLQDVKVVNLWHGVGCKNVGKAVTSGDFHEDTIRRFLMFRRYFEAGMCFLSTSPLMEKHFGSQLLVRDDQFIHGAYPCNGNEMLKPTFDHNLLKRSLPTPETKAVLYAPTYRDEGMPGFMDRALPDVDRLVQTLEKHDLALVVKSHPRMEADPSFQAFKRLHEKEPRIVFWNNDNDLYEVIDQIDAAVVDYSSIFYDLLANGCRQFVRYFFDLEDIEEQGRLASDVREMTCGTQCDDFEGLLAALADLNPVDEADAQRICDLFWAHGTKGDRAALVDTILAFEPDVTRPLRTLFTYDIFDTLIARSTLQQAGVFCYVKTRMESSPTGFPRHLINEYEMIRQRCEWDERDALDADENRSFDEISLGGILGRMQDIYQLSDEQVRLLEEWELEGELRALIPVQENVSEIQMLINANAPLLLICDTYLPRSFVTTLLSRIDERIAALPMYLSSEVGLRKTDGALFMHIFHDIDFPYDEWIHKGDDEPSDSYKAFMLGIRNMWYKGGVKPGEYAIELVEDVRTFDSYQIGRVLSRAESDTAMRSDEERFAACFAPPLLLPFVFWMLDDACKRGIDHLYFLSSDGRHLKAAADTIIESRGLGIHTHLLQEATALWCLAAQHPKISNSFFSASGLLSQAHTLDAILEASRIDEETFVELVPELAHLTSQRAISEADNSAVRAALARSKGYIAHIEEVAHKTAPLVSAYLAQEVDFSQSLAFVQYLDKYDLQECLSPLLKRAGLAKTTTFYHAQSNHPSKKPCLKRTFVANNANELLFVDLLLENTPQERTVGYERMADDSIEVTTEPTDHFAPTAKAIDASLEGAAIEFSGIDYLDQDTAMRDLFTFALKHVFEHAKDPLYLAAVAPLRETGAAGNKSVDFAPEWNLREVGQRMQGKMKLTGNRDMSLARSKIAYKAMFWGFQGMKAVGEFLQLDRDETAGEKVVRKYRESREEFIDPAIERYRFGKVYPKIYLKRARRMPVNPRKVVFLDVHETEMPDAFELIWRRLESDYDFELTYLTLDDNHVNELFREDLLHRRRIAITKQLADAAYIFLSDANDLVSCLPLRNETRVCQTWHACGAFKKWGMSTANLTFGRDREGLLEHPYYGNLDLVTVSSPEVEWAYREAMVLEDTPEVVKAIGVSRTDVFFDPDFTAQARERIRAVVPAIEGKKILLYAPTYRGGINNAICPLKFDLKAMRAALGDEWVFIIKHHPFVHDRDPIPEAVADFAFDVSVDLTIEDLLAVSDACITDYSSVVFEFCLHDRPMIFYPYDLGGYLNRRGFYYDYSEMSPGPIFFEPSGIIDYLTHLDERFDVQAIRDFRYRFMRSCDGHSTDRILDFMFGEELERHRR